jgi:hypothetical protein
MAHSAPIRAKIPTKNPQPSRAGVTRPAASGARPGRTGRPVFATGTGRAATRGDGRVVELECGVTVYPARLEGDRWRAVWYENGRRRQCEAVAEDKLAAKLARVTERLASDAPNLERPGADLIAWYLCPDWHPAGRPWSRRHADTQRRLCERFVAPVIGTICCQDIRVADMHLADGRTHPRAAFGATAGVHDRTAETFGKPTKLASLSVGSRRLTKALVALGVTPARAPPCSHGTALRI